MHSALHPTHAQLKCRQSNCDISKSHVYIATFFVAETTPPSQRFTLNFQAIFCCVEMRSLFVKLRVRKKTKITCVALGITKGQGMLKNSQVYVHDSDL